MVQPKPYRLYCGYACILWAHFLSYIYYNIIQSINQRSKFIACEWLVNLPCLDQFYAKHKPNGIINPNEQNIKFVAKIFEEIITQILHWLMSSGLQIGSHVEFLFQFGIWQFFKLQTSLNHGIICSQLDIVCVKQIYEKQKKIIKSVLHEMELTATN